MNPRNIEEYVINKILKNNEEVEHLKKQIKDQDMKIKKMKRLLKDNNICFECVCSRCKKKIRKDDIHSHEINDIYPILCYICFFQVL